MTSLVNVNAALAGWDPGRINLVQTRPELPTVGLGWKQVSLTWTKVAKSRTV